MAGANNSGTQHLPAVGDLDFAARVLESTAPVLVDFWAPWCAQCRLMTPGLSALASEWSDRVEIVAVNADVSLRTVEAYGVLTLPTLILFRGGDIAWRATGARTKATLTQELEELV